MKSYRSVLSVPGNNEKMHLKALGTNVDMIMFDLEDSVGIQEKPTARELVVRSLNSLNFGDKLISVRINPVDTYFCYNDLISVIKSAGSKIDSIVIPKVNNAAHIHFADNLLNQLQSEMNLSNSILLEPSIETAMGLDNIRVIASSSRRLYSLVFGIADYTASIGAKVISVSGHGENETEFGLSNRWIYVQSKIVNTAKAYDLLAVDAPYGNFKDNDGLKNTCFQSASLGFDAKWAIHPSQIDIINKEFSPTVEEFEIALKVVSVYESENNKGAVQLDGRMIDNATYNLAKKKLNKYNF